ncbi:ferric iron reductase [Longispora albida]|uniref:ferric iron reductase n=1 Tax=Longispora albida TaxID=203523 RepID=UPI000377C274|nr:ferric iron reductase [Longispora albida]
MDTGSVTTATPAAHALPASSSFVSPLQPILGMLAAIRQAQDAPLGVADGLIVPPAADGWLPGTAFADGTAIADLLAGPRHRWDALPHASATLAWKAYAYWLALPAVLGYTAVRRVPLLHAGNVVVRLSTGKPYVTIGIRRLALAVLPNDPAAGQPGVRVLPDEDALLDVFRETLVDQHLAPVLHQIRQQARVGKRPLWGSLASAVAQGVAKAADTLPVDAVATATQLLDTFGVSDLVDVERKREGGLAVQRRTCCLAFTVSCLKTCSTCCLPAGA